MGEPTPLQDLMVNDRYWLARARGMVDQAVKARDEAAGRLVTGVGWLWTVYTGAALVGVALANRSLDGWRVGLLVLPGVLLVVAYGLAVWALWPVAIAFDPRVVEEIQAAHLHAATVKRRRVWLAGVTAGVGAVAVVAAVFATATAPATPAEPRVAAIVQSRPGGGVVVLVGGVVPLAAGQPVTVTVTSERGSSVVMVTTADPTGRVQVQAPLADSVGSGSRVRLAWTDGKQQWTLTLPVTLAPSP
jgi:hypothetical protein